MTSFFLIGNIASGKSTAARYFACRGARCIDLDRFAKDLYVPGSDIVNELVQEFGVEILDAFGGVDAHQLASRAFESPFATTRLNDIVHPVLKARLAQVLMPVPCASMAMGSRLTVVEASVPEAVRDLFPLVDEVLAICAPYEIRRQRAIARGMDPDDFARRASRQPSDAAIAAMATSIIDNSYRDVHEFEDALDDWLLQRGLSGSLGCSEVAHD